MQLQYLSFCICFSSIINNNSLTIDSYNPASASETDTPSSLKKYLLHNMKSILLFIAATVLLSLSVAVMAQKAYPEQSGVTLIGQPSLNALHFGIDLPASAINAAADRTEQEEEEESPMDDTSLVILPTALGDEEESVMADSNSGNSCRQSYSYPLFKQCDSRWGGNRLGSSVKISFFIESCLYLLIRMTFDTDSFILLNMHHDLYHRLHHL